MKTKTVKVNKSAAIRKALQKGTQAKAIAKRLGVPVNYVYTINWNMKKKQRTAKSDGLKVVATKRGNRIISREDFLKAGEKIAAHVNESVKPIVETSSPYHYTVGGIETWDFIDAKRLPYHLASVVKYVSRAQYKGNELTDCKKAFEHLNRHIMLLEGVVG